MREMGKWQLISFISRISAMAIGLIQSFVIIRVLSLGEWGIVQLAVSIGGALGIYQHLGLAAASTREIAAAKNDSEVFKVFLTSMAIRYIVTIPLAVGLFIGADKLALSIYNEERLIFPLKIYAASLLFIGAQSILNSVISGTKRFKRLFIYQVLVSVINVLIFIPMVVLYKINGYFWAYFIFNFINTIILFYLAFRPLKGRLVLPSAKDFRLLFKEIFSISIAIYFVKILATNWEKLGPNLLGMSMGPETVAVFAFALLYAKKILSISDSITDVSLPVLSEKFTLDKNDFRDTFTQNFRKVFGYIVLAASIACYWAPQVIRFLVGGEKYSGAYVYIPFVLSAFVIYSIADILKSSIFVPAKLTKEMVFGYMVLFLSTLIAFFVIRTGFESLYAMAISLTFGAVIGILCMFSGVRRSLNLTFFTYKHWLVLLQSGLIGWAGINMALVSKAVLFPVYIGLLVWAMFIANIISKTDTAGIPKMFSKFRRHE